MLGPLAFTHLTIPLRLFIVFFYITPIWLPSELPTSPYSPLRPPLPSFNWAVNLESGRRRYIGVPTISSTAARLKCELANAAANADSMPGEGASTVLCALDNIVAAKIGPVVLFVSGAPPLPCIARQSVHLHCKIHDTQAR